MVQLARLMETGTCRSCQQPIVWALTEKRKSMPVHATRDSAGKVVPWEAGREGNLVDTGRTAFGRLGAQVPVVKVVRKGFGRWVSHFAHCPNAEQHRRRG